MRRRSSLQIEHQKPLSLPTQNRHDTMVFRKKNPIPQIYRKRYNNEFEYMFVFSKGAVETHNPIMVDCLHAGLELGTTTYKNYSRQLPKRHEAASNAAELARAATSAVPAALAAAATVPSVVANVGTTPATMPTKRHTAATRRPTLKLLSMPAGLQGHARMRWAICLHF